MKDFEKINWKKSFIINIFSRIGADKPDDVFQDALFDLLDMTSLLGILGYYLVYILM